MERKLPKKWGVYDLFIYFLLKTPFYWLTTYFSLIAYRYANIKIVNFPVNKSELKLQANAFLKKNQLIPENANIEKIEYQETDETDKDNIFIKINYLVDNQHYTKNLFIKFMMRKDRSIFLNAFDNGIRIGRCRELYFYENIASQIPISIPKFLCGQFHSFSGFGFIVFERIENARIVHDYEEISLDLVLLCIKKMAAIHAKFINHDFERLNKYFTERRNSDPFRWILLFKKVRENRDYITIFEKLCAHIDTLDPTLIHCDFRFGNMVFETENNKIKNIILADWQYPCISICLYDFCYFIVLVLSTNLRREYQQLLIQTYIDALNSHGYQYPKQSFINDYNVTLCLVVFCSAAYLMIGYFKGNGTPREDEIAWLKRLYAICSDLDSELLAKVIQIDREKIQNVINNTLKPWFLTEEST